MAEEKTAMINESSTPKTAEELVVQLFLQAQSDKKSTEAELIRYKNAFAKVSSELVELKALIKKYATYTNDEGEETGRVSMYFQLYSWHDKREHAEEYRDFVALKALAMPSDEEIKRLKEKAEAESEATEEAAE